MRFFLINSKFLINWIWRFLRQTLTQTQTLKKKTYNISIIPFSFHVQMIHLYCNILFLSNSRHILCNTYLFVQFFSSVSSTFRQMIFLIDSGGVFTYITLLLLHYSRLRKHNAYITLYVRNSYSFNSKSRWSNLNKWNLC